MEIRHLKLIKAVAEYKSLTRAGNKLFLTQSALSHQVKEIEDEYKTKLFLRINKQMLLTPAGERFLKTAIVILEEIEKNNIDIKRIRGEELETIRIGAESYSAYQWLSPLLRHYKVKFPKIDLRIVTEATKLPLEFLNAGKLDVAIVCNTSDNAHFLLHPLFEDEVVVVFHRDHKWSKLKYIGAEDFIEENYITYTVPAEETATFDHIFHGSGYVPEKVIKVELTEAIIELVKAGMGVTILPKWAVPYLNKSELATLPIGEKGLKRAWSAATVAAAEEQKHLIEFIKILKETSQKQLNAK